MPVAGRPVILERIGGDAELAESPSWLDGGRVGWVDATAGAFHSAPLAGEAVPGHTTWSVPDAIRTGAPVSAALADASGGLVLATGQRLLTFDAGSGTPHGVVSDRLPRARKGERFNDAKVGPDGRIWAGTVTPGVVGGGALWSVGADGSVRRHLVHVSHGNGLGWSPDGTLLYFVDSGRGTVSRMTFDVDSGTIGPPVRMHQTPRRCGLPDGLAVDVEGFLWLAVWGAHSLVRLDPEGREVARLELPERNVTSCAFVGDGLRLLAVTTAADEPAEGEARGAVHLVDPGVAGVPVSRFPVHRPRGDR